MGNQENCVPTTNRNSKNHPGVSEKLARVKKRVALGDITNTFGTELTQISSHSKTQKPERALLKKDATNQETALARSNDSQNCVYCSSIYNYLYTLEKEEGRRPRPNYMESVQNDLTANMREILVEWLVEVAEEYRLVSDTLFLSISYIDRFLSSHALNRKKLQLLGVSCMLVASKYEEITPPNVEDFCYVTDNTYTKEEVVAMERDVLKLLDFQMGSPTIKTFLRSMTRLVQEEYELSRLQLEFLGCYLAELSLLDYGCVRFLPSQLAASVIFLARFITKPDMHPWSSALQCYSGYTPAELKDCVLAVLSVLLRQNASSGAVKLKYLQHKFKCVSALATPSDIPGCYFEAFRR